MENIIVVNGKTFTSVTDAMKVGTEDDLKKFCEEKLFYDYGEICANFIIENKEEIKKYVDTLINLEEE